MSKGEFERLKDSIRESGLLEPIVLHKDGRILDGRCRQEICEEIGLDPKYRNFNDDDEAAARFVVAMNIARRHLTTSQCAALGAEALDWYEAEAKKRQEEAGKAAAKKGGETGGKGRPKKDNSPSGKNSTKANDKGKAVARAAADFKTNPKYVQQAKKLKEEAPDLHEQVKKGEVKIGMAMKKLKERKKERRQKEDPEGAAIANEGELRSKVDQFNKKSMRWEQEWIDLVAEFRETKGVGKACVSAFETAIGFFDRCRNLYEEAKDGSRQNE